MIVFNKGKFSLVKAFLRSIFVLLFLNLSISYAQTGNDGLKGLDNTAVKIPPPLDGVVITPHNTYQTLEKASISILTNNNTRHNFTVELARTSQEQGKGMMFRRNIPQNTGMLFLFKDERERNFWMKNTPVSLDIIFIRKDGIVHHIHPNAEINTLTRISSDGVVSAVLEIGAGEAERLGFHVGDRILYDAFNP